MLLFASYLMFFCFVFFRKCDKHSCSASAIINLSMVSIVDNLLSTLHASANRILHCEANTYFIGSGCADSLSFFFLGCHSRFSHLAHACIPLTKSEENVITYLSSALLCFADLCRSLHFMTCDICWFLLASVIRFKFLFI